MNHITLRGYVANDPYISKGKGKKAVASFSLGVPDRSAKKNEEGNYPSDFFQLVAFAPYAEVIEKYVEKGSELLVSGRLATSTYDNKDRETKHVVQVIIGNMEFLSRKNA